MENYEENGKEIKSGKYVLTQGKTTGQHTSQQKDSAKLFNEFLKVCQDEPLVAVNIENLEGQSKKKNILSIKERGQELQQISHHKP